MELHFKAQPPTEGYRTVAGPANSPLRWLSLGLLDLPGKGKSYEEQLGGDEALLTLLCGKGTVEVYEPSGRSALYEIGPRRDTFVDKATMVYLPPQASYRVVSTSPDFKGVIHHAPAMQEGSSFLIEPHTLRPVSTGVHNWRRDVMVCTSANMPVQRFIAGETITPPGNWASYPSHKHDELREPYEAPYEEVYYFLFKPPQGFGFIRLYDPPQQAEGMDQALVIKNGDTVIVPRGYHPLVVAPGYQLYLLFCLVGQARVYGAWSDDPDHAWVRACEAIMER